GLLESLPDTDLVLARTREERGARLVTEAARRRVEHAREGECVLGISDEPEIRERVLHLTPLVEGDAADDLVCEAERAELVLDRTRLRTSSARSASHTRSSAASPSTSGVR